MEEQNNIEDGKNMFSKNYFIFILSRKTNEH